jgi:hypothetical protein
MKMYRFFLIVITLLFTFAANALEITRAKYEHFTVDEGLSQIMLKPFSRIARDISG